MNSFIRTCLSVALCFSFCVSASQLYGQVTYSISGFVDDNGFGPAFSGPLAGESYVAEFEIDTSVLDVDNVRSDRGEYPGAILSASVVFESGFVSEVDFSGGIVTVLQDAGGGGFFLQDASQDSTFIVYDLGNPFDSDALPTDPALQFTASPDSLVLLDEPSLGRIISFSDVDLDSPADSRAIVFSVVSGATSVLRGDCNLDGVIDFGDIPAFVGALSGGTNLDQADCNEDGAVDFGDIPSFVDILSSSSGSSSSS